MIIKNNAYYTLRIYIYRGTSLQARNNTLFTTLGPPLIRATKYLESYHIIHIQKLRILEAALKDMDENFKMIRYLTNLIAGYDIGSSHDIGGPLGGLDENTLDETPSWPPERKYVRCLPGKNGKNDQ